MMIVYVEMELQAYSHRVGVVSGVEQDLLVP